MPCQTCMQAYMRHVCIQLRHACDACTHACGLHACMHPRCIHVRCMHASMPAGMQASVHMLMHARVAHACMYRTCMRAWLHGWECTVQATSDQLQHEGRGCDALPCPCQCLGLHHRLCRCCAAHSSVSSTARCCKDLPHLHLCNVLHH